MGLLSALSDIILRWIWPHAYADKVYQRASGSYASYQKSKQLKQLQTALKDYESALVTYRKAEKPDPARIALTCANYAAALWTLYESENRPKSENRSEQLKRVIDLNEEALSKWKNVQPKPDNYPTVLLHLANAYLAESQQVGDATQEDSFAQAERLYDELRQDPSVPSLIRRKMLMIFGTALSTRCGRKNNTERLDEAIDFLGEARGLFDSTDAITSAQCSYNLGNAYATRYRLTSDPENLDSAIKNYTAAENLLDGHPDRLPCLFNLAQQLFKRYEAAQQQSGHQLLVAKLDPNRGVNDLNQAEIYGQKALGLLADDSPSKVNIGRLLEVIKRHQDGLSQRRSPTPSPNATPNPSPGPSPNMLPRGLPSE